MGIRRTILVGTALVFIVLLAACATQSTPLLDTAWVLISLNDNALIEGKEITLNFGEETLDGSGGCNIYGGNFKASGDSLSLSGVYATEMACMEPEGIMEQEQAYFQALNATTSYQVDGDRLVIYDKVGTQILVFTASTSEVSSGEDIPMDTSPSTSMDCALEMDETSPEGNPVSLRFELHNQTDQPVYVLTWYTPLEGLAGDIFQITRNGEELIYQGTLAKRGDPIREEYIAIEPRKSVFAEVDLDVGYDLSTPGTYDVQFTSGIQDATSDASLLPRIQDDHQQQSLSCNTVSFEIIPAPEPATPTPVVIVPPEGFQQYLDSDTGVSLWVPEDWTIVQSGLKTGLPDGTTRLQSYPEGKYIGGEPRQPGDTKCDLTIHPPETRSVDLIAKRKSDPLSTIVSEEEIVLQSGLPGTRMEIESMGTGYFLITEVNELVVELTCFGEIKLFDEIAGTIATSE